MPPLSSKNTKTDLVLNPILLYHPAELRSGFFSLKALWLVDIVDSPGLSRQRPSESHEILYESLLHQWMDHVTNNIFFTALFGH